MKKNRYRELQAERYRVMLQGKTKSVEPTLKPSEDTLIDEVIVSDEYDQEIIQEVKIEPVVKKPRRKVKK